MKKIKLTDFLNKDHEQKREAFQSSHIYAIMFEKVYHLKCEHYLNIPRDMINHIYYECCHIEDKLLAKVNFNEEYIYIHFYNKKNLINQNTLTEIAIKIFGKYNLL